MAKRTVAALAALLILTNGTAGAATAPEWPCTVPVWIEDGARLPRFAKIALAQLDEATVISWPVVDDRADAMVAVDWVDLPKGGAGLASVSASDVEKVAGEVLVDPTVSNRWAIYTFLHELGHIAGLDHNDEVSVMGGGDVPFKRFTEWDLARLAEVACRA